jgi:hypothetical protein
LPDERLAELCGGGEIPKPDASVKAATGEVRAFRSKCNVQDPLGMTNWLRRHLGVRWEVPDRQSSLVVTGHQAFLTEEALADIAVVNRQPEGLPGIVDLDDQDTTRRGNRDERARSD